MDFKGLLAFMKRFNVKVGYVISRDTQVVMIGTIDFSSDIGGTIEFSSEITISSSFTAERAENAEALENPSVNWNNLKLCALCDLRVDKSLVFSIVPAESVFLSSYTEKSAGMCFDFYEFLECY